MAVEGRTNLVVLLKLVWSANKFVLITETRGLCWFEVFVCSDVSLVCFSVCHLLLCMVMSTQKLLLIDVVVSN